MSLNGRARRLIAAKGIGGTDKPARPVGLAWCSLDVEVDLAALPPGSRVLEDHVILERNWPDGPDLVSIRQRVAVGPGDRGAVLAWDGSSIGFVIVEPSGGVLLEFVWPSSLPGRDPAAAAGA